MLVLLPTVMLAVGACSGGGPSSSEDVACNSISAWLTGGQEASRFEEMVTAARDALVISDDEALVALADELVSAPEAERTDRAEEFMGRCRDLRWEPPEG